MSDETGFMEIDGVRLEYAWHGPGPDQQPTILLLHEGLGSVSNWRDFPARLSNATGLGVLVYSRRGHGTSDPCDLPRPLTFMHDEAFDVVPKVIDRWKLRKVFLAGISDGGSIATIYAGGVADPRIRCVMLISTHFFNEDVCVDAISKAKEAYEHGDLKTNLERHHGDNVDCAFYGWCQPWLDPDFATWTIEDYLQHIRVPILLIWGARDPYGSFAQVEAARSHCMCPLEVVVLDESSHWAFREQPRETLQTITDFTRRLTDLHDETVKG